MMGLLWMAAAATAAPGPDAIISSDQPEEMLQECIRQTLAGADVDAEPLPTGMRILITLPGHPGRLFYDLTDIDGTRHVAVTHDPPATIGDARSSFADIGGQCFPAEMKAAGIE